MSGDQVVRRMRLRCRARNSEASGASIEIPIEIKVSRRAPASPHAASVKVWIAGGSVYESDRGTELAHVAGEERMMPGR
jgi:hypothetical protein